MRGKRNGPTPPRYTENFRTVVRRVRLHRGDPAARAHADSLRPQTRADCEAGPRPCPFVSCKYHLFSDIVSTGTMVLRGDGSVEELVRMPETCALDVAGRGPATLDEVGEFMAIHRERVRQIQTRAERRLRAHIERITN